MNREFDKISSALSSLSSQSVDFSWDSQSYTMKKEHHDATFKSHYEESEIKLIMTMLPSVFRSVWVIRPKNDNNCK